MKKQKRKVRDKLLSKRDLNFDFLSQINVTIDPKITNKLQAVMANQIAKLFSLFIYFKRLKGRVYRLQEHFITLHDGAKLATDIYLPENIYKRKERAPTIIIRTPYWKDSVVFIGYLFALKGYVGVIQDVRGAAHSNPYGSNSFFFSERNDGLETAEWIKKRFWYNGKIGMWGASYFGITQWAVSYDNNNLLTCLNPALSSPVSVWNVHNGLDPLSIGVDVARIFHEVSKFHDEQTPKRFSREITHQYTENLLRNPKYALYNDPIDRSNFLYDLDDFKDMDFDQMVNFIQENWKFNINKPDFKSFLKLIFDMILRRKMDLQTRYLPGMLDFDPKKIQTPLLILSGWYDMFNRASMEAFMEIMEKGSDFAKKNTRIIIGPWAHGDVQTRAKLWNLLFSPGGWLDFFRTFSPWNWFHYWLKGVKTMPDIEKIRARLDLDLDLDYSRLAHIEELFEIENKPPIKLYVINKNEWRYEREWPLKRQELKKLYLHSAGKANTSRGNGKLNWDYPGENEPNDYFIFDPMNPVITCGGDNLMLPRGAMVQNRTESRNDVLVYTSPPLEIGMEVTGNIEMVLYASSSAPDTDFMVKLCDVYPNGKSYNILDSGIRARFRDFDYKHPKLLKPGDVYEFRIPIGPTSYFFKEKHRIRLDITSSNYPKYNINANLGGERTNGKKYEYDIAHQKIFHDAEHPSYILLPIIRPKYF
ncbi:MAG: CocE/NonD family hydrolase [Promethearchaeota archaeon]